LHAGRDVRLSSPYGNKLFSKEAVDLIAVDLVILIDDNLRVS
jgi:hypothetical protein